MSNQLDLTASAYVLPAISTWLSQIGLGANLVEAGGVYIEVDHFPHPIPTPIAPVFFTQLQRANFIYVYECEDCTGGPFFPPTSSPSVLTALPGLRNVVELAQPYAQPSLLVTGTAFKDLSSFGGLACQTSGFSILNNTALQTFDGLNAVQPVPMGSYVYALDSGPFDTPASVAGLRSMAGCLSGVKVIGSAIIPRSCGTITSLADICTYNGTSNCR